jgi:predicted metal-dependent hydrolase
MPLLTDSRFPDPDLAYRALIEAHRGLSDEASAALNTRLVLLLANHIGDQEVLAEALRLAKGTLPQAAEGPETVGFSP